jgi:hypothetical protein
LLFLEFCFSPLSIILLLYCLTVSESPRGRLPVPFGASEAAPASVLRPGALSGGADNDEGVFDAPEMIEVYAVSSAQ